MFYCAGNWKLNKTPAEATEFAQALKTRATGARMNAFAPGERGDSLEESLVLLPPALAAYAVAEALKGTAIGWGGQNCHAEAKGAFTGENSAEVLRVMGATYCLVGHSERRALFGERDELLARKVKLVQEQGLTPILCVGETLAERQAGRTREVIVGQLKAGLENAVPTHPLWIAYEPVWAIGTGQVATTEQVREAHALLREALREWSAAVGPTVPILYGGSVKPDNAGALAKIENVGGFLVGGASLKVDEFLKIAEAARG